MNEGFHRAADAALSQGRIAEAITALEQAGAAASCDFQAWIKLAALRRQLRDPVAALVAVNAALDARPNEFLALLLKASLHEQLGEGSRAAEVYRAVVHFAAEKTNLPPPVQAQVEHAKEFLAGLRRGVEGEMTILATLDPERRQKAMRFLDYVMDRRKVYHQQPTHYRYPGLPDVEFFDHAYPELCDRLRKAFPAIRSEFEALYASRAERLTPYVNYASGQPMGQWAPLNRSPKWNVFHLIRYGEPDPVNAPLCPQTIAAVAGEDQADVAGVAPNLLFSLLAPRTAIPPHHGVANFRVLMHLPLIVPQGCQFRVGADTRPWIEGEPWIFDDSIEHEAWNDSDELRVILIGDFWRPELDRQDRSIIRNYFETQAEVADLGAM